MTILTTRPVLIRPTFPDMDMAKGKFHVPDVKHIGDIQHCESLIKDNGGTQVRHFWNGEEDGDAIIVFFAETEEKIKNIKSILENE